MYKDDQSNMDARVAVPNTAISGNGTTNGNIIDTKGYGALTFLVVGGTLTDGTYTPLIKDSDDSGMSGEAAVTDDFLVTTDDADTAPETSAALAAATDDNIVKRIGYVGHKRYVTCDIVASGVTTGGNVSVIAVLSDPQDLPVDQGSA
jgi:hypothetical protein